MVLLRAMVFSLTMTERSFLLILAGIILILVFVAPFFGWHLQQLFGQSSSASSLSLALVSEVVQKQHDAAIAAVVTPDDALALRAVSIFSRYPFNFKNEVLIDSGKKHSVHVGEAFVVAQNQAANSAILLGAVSQVFDDSATVETIFDQRWRSAARVGAKGVEALLVGGIEPRLTLIAKSGEIKPGDVVYSADPRFPYGLALARVKDIALSQNQASQEATLQFTYDINDIQAAALITNYAAPQGSKE